MVFNGRSFSEEWSFKGKSAHRPLLVIYTLFLFFKKKEEKEEMQLPFAVGKIDGHISLWEIIPLPTSLSEKTCLSHRLLNTEIPVDISTFSSKIFFGKNRQGYILLSEDKNNITWPHHYRRSYVNFISSDRKKKTSRCFFFLHTRTKKKTLKKWSTFLLQKSLRKNNTV